MNARSGRAAALALTLLAAPILDGCSAARFFGYKWFPDYPTWDDGAQIALPELEAPVAVTVRTDGLPVVRAQNEADLYRAVGYLQARDRMFQMDLLRHMAHGRVAELVGNMPSGDKTTLDVDRLNRFLGLSRDAEALLAAMDERDRRNLDAFTAGVNHWVATGQATIEHRLLGAKVAAWRPVDTLAIFRLLMFGLTHNYTRELRRLLIACDAGLDAQARIWPTNIEFGPHLLPSQAFGPATHPVLPSVAPELAAALPELCGGAAADEAVARAAPPATAAAAGAPRWLATLSDALAIWSRGWQASNNWALAPERTATGGALVMNDPHLPHLNPPIVWGARYELDGERIEGFAIPGIPHIVFGQNGHVAWSLTINNVDLQDLYVERPGAQPGTYLVDGTVHRYRRVTETFGVRGGDSVTATARFSHHGPILNDLDPFLAGRIPPTALRTVPMDGALDARAFRDLRSVRSTSELVAAATPMDSACLNWVFGDDAGRIGWFSPCRVPRRASHLGDFPVPGWLSAYDWQGTYAKDELPRSLEPDRGWHATGNNRVMPVGAFPTPYDNDPSPPNRYVRISQAVDAVSAATIAWNAALQLDTAESYWPDVRAELDAVFCQRHPADDAAVAAGRAALCAWDGALASDSSAATLFILMTHAMLDRALSDELSDGADGKLWHYVQSIPHFETNVDWLFQRPVSDPVWDDVRTDATESKLTVVDAALHDAVATAGRRWGADPRRWKWGEVRPFVLEHPFGKQGGMVGELFNSPPYPGQGAPETVFKNQYLRSDRERMHPGIGAVVHLIYDLGPDGGTYYNLAGGQSGWPRHPNYADQLGDWRTGVMRRLDREEPGMVAAEIRLVPQ